MDEKFSLLSQRWSKIAWACPVAQTVKEGAASAAYVFQVFDVLKIPIPETCLNLASKSDFSVELHLNATLFDTSSSVFFGNTWSGGKIELKSCLQKIEEKTRTQHGPCMVCQLKMPEGYGFVFHSSQDLDKTVLAVEVVVSMTQKNPIRVDQLGLCWSLVHLHPSGEFESFSLPRDEPSLKSSALMMGSPRLLVLAKFNLNDFKSFVLKQNSSFRYICMSFAKASNVLTELLAPNQLCGGTDPVMSTIPGITAGGQLGPKFSNIKMMPSHSLKVKNLAVKNLTVDAQTVRVELGLHNGRRFLGAQPLVACTLTRTGSEWSSKEDIVLKNFMAVNSAPLLLLLFADSTCLGWICAALVEEDDGPVLAGRYQLSMNTGKLPPSVSTLKISRKDIAALVTFQVEAGDNLKVADVAQAAKDLKRAGSKPAPPVSKPKSPSVSGSDEESVSAETASETQESEDQATPRAEAGRAAGEGEGGDGEGELSLICSLAHIPGSKLDSKTIRGIDWEISFPELSKILKEEIGTDAYISYTPVDENNRAKSPILVDSAAKLEAFLDYFFNEQPDGDSTPARVHVTCFPKDAAAAAAAAAPPAAAAAAGAAATPAAAPAAGEGAVATQGLSAAKEEKGSRHEREASTSPAEASKGTVEHARHEEGGGAAKSHRQEKNRSQQVSEQSHRDAAERGQQGHGGRAASPAEAEGRRSRKSGEAELPPPSSSSTRRGGDKEEHKELRTFEIFFPDSTTRLKDFSVSTSWAEARDRIHRLHGSGGDMLWTDGSGNQRRLSSEGSWQDLIEELQFDFAGSKTLNGVVRVKILARAAESPLGGEKVDRNFNINIPKGDRRHAERVLSPPDSIEEDSREREDVDIYRSPRSASRSQVRSEGRGHRGAGRQIVSTDTSEVDTDRGEREVSRRVRRGKGSHGHVAMDEAQEAAEQDEEVRLADKQVGESFAPLSRALKALLLRTSIRDLVPNYFKEVPLLESSIPSSSIDLGKEAMDNVSMQTVVLHILAVRLPGEHRRLSFRSHFYNSDPFETLPACIKSDGQEPAGKEDKPQLLVLESASKVEADQSAGIVLSFQVDLRREGKDLVDSRLSFARFLSSKSMQVEVWDADSSLPIGIIPIDLKVFLRQGREAQQSAGEYSILEFLSSQGGADASPVQQSTDEAPFLPNKVGSAFMRFVSVGFSSAAAGGAAAEVPREPRGAQMPDHGSRVLPLTEEATQGGSEGREEDHPHVALSLLCAYKEEMQALLRERGVEVKVSADELQKAMIQLKQLSSVLSVRQISAFCFRLSEMFQPDGRIDLEAIDLSGHAIISDRVHDKSRAQALRQHARQMLGLMTVRFGSVRKCLHNFAEGGRMTLSAYKSMVHELVKLSGLSPGLHDSDVSAFLELMGAQPVDVTAMEKFFEVKVSDKKAPGLEEVDRKKNARWQRLKASRRGERSASEEEKHLLVEAARLYRETHKDSKIKQILESSITTEEVIFPSFGEVVFLQYRLRNPYSEERVIGIRMDDEELQLVTDVEEWKHLNKIFGVSGVVESDMVAKDRRVFNVWLQAHQEIVVPFKFRSLASSLTHREAAPAGSMTRSLAEVSSSSSSSSPPVLRERDIHVTFVARRNGVADVVLYNYVIKVKPRRFVIDQVFNFYNGQNDFLKKKIVVDSSSSPSLAGWRFPSNSSVARSSSARKFTWTSDPAVVVRSIPHASDSQVEDVHIKYRCEAAGRVASFFVILYNDEYLASVFEIWQVNIHSMNRLDVQGLVGQVEREGCSITLRCRDSVRHVRGFSSHPSEFELDVKEPMSIGDALTEIPFRYHPMRAGKRDILVNFVDSDVRGPPLYRWLVCARAKLPLISKRYEISIVANKASNKKIMYTNPYSIQRTFRLRTNRPDLLSFKDNQPELHILPRGQQYIGLRFGARKAAGQEEVLVFINDEEDKNEECLAINVNYS